MRGRLGGGTGIWCLFFRQPFSWCLKPVNLLNPPPLLLPEGWPLGGGLCDSHFPAVSRISVIRFSGFFFGLFSFFVFSACFPLLWPKLTAYFFPRIFLVRERREGADTEVLGPRAPFERPGVRGAQPQPSPPPGSDQDGRGGVNPLTPSKDSPPSETEGVPDPLRVDGVERWWQETGMK